ncbi:unnamed protein product [Caenorhabditis bovis]|uniref:NWD1/2-like winged helix-turn-helix domain-containing protein n=1 Tax=Caenorhabditis bovis TaxID=2654633 RepID=A0A8S1EZA5_9PELO|nr:unnamed protein product [Caenorhabditis bovis]
MKKKSLEIGVNLGRSVASELVMFRGVSPQKTNETSQINSSTVFIVANDAEEFDVERRILWQDVLPELQNVAFQAGFDLEWVDVPLETGALTHSTVERLIQKLEENANNLIICLLGNRYGEVSAPVTLRKEEFDSIRASLFELNVDVRILDQCYTIDRTRVVDEYCISTAAIQDAKTRSKLTKAIQKGAQAAHDEGNINQVHVERQNRFFISPIDSLVRYILQTSPQRCIFLLRKFENVQFDEKLNASFVEKTEINTRNIENLKNNVSLKMTDKVMTHVLRPETSDINYFFNSRNSDKYREKISRQFANRIKTLLGETHKNIRPAPPRDIIEMARNDDRIHSDNVRKQLQIGNLPRNCVEKKLDETARLKHSSGVFLIEGPDVCGKTQTLCRLYDKISEKDAYKIIRFINLTYSSNFAHEVWRNICLTLCSMANLDASNVLEEFKLQKILDCLVEAIRKVDKPVCIFIDDIHFLKFGHFLSVLSKKVEAAPEKLSLFITSSNVSPVSSVFTITQTMNIEPIDEDELVQMLKKYVESNKRKLSGEQLGGIKNEIVESKESILSAKMYAHEILLNGSSPMKGGVDGRLERIENELGAAAVTCVCKFLSVTYHGLTRLELHDVITSHKEMFGDLNAQPTFSIILLDKILEALGPLLRKTVIDARETISIAHLTLCSIVRHRYLTTTADLKSIHIALSDLFTELYIDIENLSPRHLISYQSFPQSLKRENGSANIRKLRLLWYHLLHTGNMDLLKELALCQFDYIDLTARYFGVTHLLSLYEECAMQVLHHDLQVLCEQVLLPSLITIVRDNEQLAAEVIGRLRFTRADNSHFLNTMVEQAMGWVDTYNRQPLLVPLTCWISPPTMKTCRSFMLKDWKPGQTVLSPTQNHQHVLISGNQSAPGAIYMYHVASQILIATFKGHSAGITCLCTSNNGQFFVSTSIDKTVKLWSFLTGECVQTLKHHTQKVTCAILTSDDEFLITASADSSAKMVNVETGEVVRSFNDHTGSVVSLQLTSNNLFLITGSGDFVVQMWDVSNGNCISRMGGLMAPVSTLAITSNDAFVVVACEDETLKVFSTVSGQELHELMGHEGKVNSLVCSHDDCQLFAATKSKIFCYDIHNGQMIDILDLQQPFPICSLRISSDNYFLVSGCGPKVTIWNVQKRNHDAHDVSVDKEGFLTAVAMSYDEKVAACGTYNGIVALWDLDICQCISTIVQAKGIPVSCVCFTVDNSFLVSGNSSGNILVLDSSNGNILRDVNMHSSEIVSILSLYSGKIISCDRDDRIVQWDCFGEDDTPEMVATGVKPPIFVPPSGRIIIGHCPINPKEMKVWSIPDEGAPVQKNKLSHNEEITCFATALKGGSLVATGSIDMSLKIWQIDSGFLTQILVGHEDIVTCCCISDDERIVISGARDRKMIVWNVQTGENVCSIIASAPLTAVALTGDGSVAFSTTEEGWIEAWSTDKGTRLSTFNAHRPIRNLISSFEANRLLVHLTGCAQLPILCLHNTPATPQEATRRRSARAQSVSSITNEPASSSSSQNDIKKEQSAVGHQTGGNGAQLNSTRQTYAPRPTFDKLERSKSRTSLIEKDRPTTLTNVVAPVQKSNMCIIL